MLLVSLLRGVGYDAYVCSGYATREITMMDSSRKYTGKADENGSLFFDLKDFPEFEQIDENGDPMDVDKSKSTEKSYVTQSDSKYKVKPIRQLVSSFLKSQEEKQRVVKEKEEARRKEEERLKQACPEWFYSVSIPYVKLI